MFRICAVIVTYNPGSTFIENIAAVAAQVHHVLVVDNGSSWETAQHLQELARHPDYTVIRNQQNLGIAAALNSGVNYAIEAGFDWVATFDQDSRVTAGFIARMLETYHQVSHRERVALIAPTYVDLESGFPQRLMQTRNGEILVTMTSGNMLPSSAFLKIGGFDESLYMDYVDIEFCLRARQKGMMILQSPAVLLHSPGQITHHRLLGRPFVATNHSAERRYYITRNRIRLLGMYPADWPWLWREVKGICIDATKIALVEDNKWKKFRAVAAGAVDALTGRMGKQIEL